MRASFATTFLSLNKPDPTRSIAARSLIRPEAHKVDLAAAAP